MVHFITTKFYYYLADLEKQFHKYFFAGIHEKKLTDLVKLRQRNDESVESFVQRLQDVKK